MDENRIIAKLPKCLVVLTPAELQRLLLTDMNLYAEAVKRGKSELRYRANERRENRNIEKESF